MIKLILFLLTSLHLVVAQEDSELEAGVPCTKIECLINQYPNFTLNQVENMCRQLLPEHCEDIKPEYTRCNPNNVGKKFMGKYTSLTVQSAGTCLSGLSDGLIDVLKGVLFLGSSAVNFTLDSEYRDEAVNALSIFMSDFTTGDGAEEFKELISSSIVEYFDEIVSCLNGPGRFHYFCEFGTQFLSILKLTDLGIGGIRSITDRTNLLFTRGNVAKLTIRDKIILRAELRSKLKKGGSLIAHVLHPYQLSLLSSKQIREKLTLDYLGNAHLTSLSNRQLRAINLAQVSKINPQLVAPGVISKLSNVQFRSWSTPNNISKSPINLVELNLHRIDASLMPQVTQIGRINLSVLNKLSEAQINALNPVQAVAIRKAGKLKGMRGEKRKILDNKAKEHDLKVKRKEAEAQKKQSENQKNESERKESTESNNSGNAEAQKKQSENQKNESERKESTESNNNGNKDSSNDSSKDSGN